MEQILQYIQETYAPLSIILYGSYADGTNNLNSDFDALVITSEHELFHDTSIVNGIPLDVFVYPQKYFDVEYACEDFVQIHDGRIFTDSNGIGKALQEKVQAYLRNRAVKSSAEIRASVDWCVKMLERAKRGDCEGMFRWHWVLSDSLEIFCDIMQHPYLGPKKTLKWMEETRQNPLIATIEHFMPFVWSAWKNGLHILNISMDPTEEFHVYLPAAAFY